MNINKKRDTKIPIALMRCLSICSITLLAALTGCNDDETEIVADEKAPHVVSAISISNTEVLVQFSKPVINAEEPSNYSISNEETKTGLPIVSAAHSGPRQTTVILTTASQSSYQYKMVVANIQDEFGNPIAEPTSFVDSSVTLFVGTAPNADEIIDSDGDGLADHTEVNGWSIIVHHTDGSESIQHVSSDPGNANLPMEDEVNIQARDTDSDGVSDNEELHGGMNPRNADTDGDTLTDNQEWNIIYSDPTNQDTDGDGSQDGFEFYSFRTSPILTDTDGDQISDTDEVLTRNRNPRIADIPKVSISIGEVRLLIDERFVYEDTNGNTVTAESSSNSTLTQSTNTSYSKSNSNVTQVVAGGKLGIGAESEAGGRGNYVNVEASVEYTGSHTFTATLESAQASQNEYERSLRKAEEFSTTNTATREVSGGSINVDLTLHNKGDLAFTISNIEITVLEQDRLSPDRFTPVATLIANREIATGEPAVYNLGPFTTERGPIIFSSRDIFPDLVEGLMKAPRGLVFKIANFDMLDEYGRAFTFANQIARDRTAGIVVDTGNEEEQQFFVSTALQPDSGGFGGSSDDTPFPHVGGFNTNGSPIGIPLDFALQDTLGLQKNSTVQDGIVAGPNRTAESIAAGDDVQLILPGTTGVGVGSVIVSAGQNGTLDTLALGDDIAEVTTGYETSLSCNAVSDNAGESCSVHQQCTGIGEEDILPSCSGPEVLVRFNGYRNGDLNRNWVVMTTRQLRAGADFGQVILQPGADIFLAFVQDLDEDGLFAREEYLYGSTDSRADIFDNSLFGENFDESSATVRVPDNIADSKDTDRDGLGDFAEVRIGWTVSADGGRLKQVYSSPRMRDSDNDGLLDPVEQDLRRFCVTDDNRTDALCVFQSEPPVTIEQAVVIIAGANGIADSIASPDDEQLINPGDSQLAYGTPIIGAGDIQGIQTVLLGDDQYDTAISIPPATDPSLRDTDLDNINDFEELTGFDIGHSVRDGSNGIIESRAIGDDIQRGYINNPIKPGGIVILPGANGRIDSFSEGDDIQVDGITVVTDPLRRDTDRDSVSDGRELEQGGNPTDDSDAQDFKDTDLDGLTDAEEAELGWLVVVDGNTIEVLSNPNLPDSDFDGLPDFIERDLRTNPNNIDTDQDGISDYNEFADFARYDGLQDLYPNLVLDSSGSARLGTDPRKTDTDGDNLSDSCELLKGYRYLAVGDQTPRLIFTNPLDVDTDFDGASDDTERGVTCENDASQDLLEAMSLIEVSVDEIWDYLLTDNNDWSPMLIMFDDISTVIANTPNASQYDLLDNMLEQVEMGINYINSGSVRPQPLWNRVTDMRTIISNAREAPVATDATDSDSDDDGKLDGQELIDGTNPLVRDIKVSLTYLNLEIINTNGLIPRNFFAQWVFRYSTAETGFPGDTTNTIETIEGGGRQIVDCNSGTGDSENRVLQAGLQDVIPLHPTNNSITSIFTLVEGQGLTLNGSLFEFGCATATRARRCSANFLIPLTYDDLDTTRYRVETEQLIDRSCSANLSYQIIVE